MSNINSISSLGIYLSNQILNKFVEKLEKFEYKIAERPYFKELFLHCSENKINPLEQYYNILVRKLTNILENLYVVNEIHLDFLLMASIYLERLVNSDSFNMIDGNNCVDFFISCLAILLKFNNDYYYLPVILSNSPMLMYDYSCFEIKILDSLDYKLLIQDKEIKKIKKNIKKQTKLAPQRNYNNDSAKNLKRLCEQRNFKNTTRRCNPELLVKELLDNTNKIYENYLKDIQQSIRTPILNIQQ